MNFSSTVLILVALVAFFNLAQVVCRPQEGYQTSEEYEPSSWKEKEDVQYCYKNTKHLETCQRCAKLTKSPIVYPLCCTNKEQALKWCEEYLDFGIQTQTKKRDLMNYHRYEVI